MKLLDVPVVLGKVCQITMILALLLIFSSVESFGQITLLKYSLKRSDGKYFDDDKKSDIYALVLQILDDGREKELFRTEVIKDVTGSKLVFKEFKRFEISRRYKIQFWDKDVGRGKGLRRIGFKKDSNDADDLMKEFTFKFEEEGIKELRSGPNWMIRIQVFDLRYKPNRNAYSNPNAGYYRPPVSRSSGANSSTAGDDRSNGEFISLESRLNLISQRMCSDKTLKIVGNYANFVDKNGSMIVRHRIVPNGGLGGATFSPNCEYAISIGLQSSSQPYGALRTWLLTIQDLESKRLIKFNIADPSGFKLLTSQDNTIFIVATINTIAPRNPQRRIIHIYDMKKNKIIRKVIVNNCSGGCLGPNNAKIIDGNKITFNYDGKSYGPFRIN